MRTRRGKISTTQVAAGATADVAQFTVPGLTGTVSYGAWSGSGYTVDPDTGQISLTASIDNSSIEVFPFCRNENGVGAGRKVALQGATVSASVVPATVPDFLWGINAATNASWDASADLFGDLGYTGTWQQLNPSNGFAGGIYDPETAEPTGALDAGYNAHLWKVFEGRTIGVGCGGNVRFEPLFDTTGWTFSVFSQGTGCTCTHVGNGVFEAVIDENQRPSLSLKMVPPAPGVVPGNIRYRSYRYNPAGGAVLSDTTKITSATARAQWGSATPFNIVRALKLAEGEQRLQQISVWPYVRHIQRSFSPRVMTKLAVELGKHIQYCVPYLVTNEQYILHAQGFAARVLGDAAWCASPFAFLFELGNEIWNPNYAYSYSRHTVCMFDANTGGRFLSGIDTSAVVNEYPETPGVYPPSKVKSSWSATTLGRTMTFGERVLIQQPNGYEDMLVECIAPGGAAIGDGIPANTLNAVNGQNTVRCIAAYYDLYKARDKWRAWMTGEYIDAFNAVVGAEKAWGYFGWGSNVPNIAWVSQALLAGGTGTEYGRRIRYQGRSHYTSIIWNVPNPPASGWGALVDGGDFELSVDGFFDDFDGRLAVVVGDTASNFNSIRTTLNAAGIGADWCMGHTYEGGLHFGPLNFSTNAQRQTWGHWFDDVRNHPRMRAWSAAQTEAFATASPALKGLTEFSMAEHTNYLTTSIQLTQYGVENRMGENAQRYLGLLDGIAAVEGP